MTPESLTPPDIAGQVIEIRTTFSSRDDAERCARKLIDRRLAACVQVDGPVTSVYRWQGRVEAASEYRCTCKTAPARAAACIAALRDLHPYDLPEILQLPVAATPDYARWVQEHVDA